jgi:hypothetical protein
VVAFCVLLLLMSARASAQTDPLPSWNDGPAKQAIVEFVRATTDKASSKFVPPEARIAAFDQDGTTWVEQPMYAQVMFALHQVPTFSDELMSLAKKQGWVVISMKNDWKRIFAFE